MPDPDGLPLTRAIAAAALAATVALALTPEAPLQWARDAPLPPALALAAIDAAEAFADAATIWGLDGPTQALSALVADLRDR